VTQELRPVTPQALPEGRDQQAGPAWAATSLSWAAGIAYGSYPGLSVAYPTSVQYPASSGATAIVS
jgi:hypothetical protein